MGLTMNPEPDLEPPIDKRKPIGICEECGEEVYENDDISFEDDAPFTIENMWFHERCIMQYARSNWRVV